MNGGIQVERLCELYRFLKYNDLISNAVLAGEYIWNCHKFNSNILFENKVGMIVMYMWY